MAKAPRRHTSGGGAVVPGLRRAFTHLRGPERNRQVILAVDPITADGPADQAMAAVMGRQGHLVIDRYLQAAADLPGLLGYANDRTLRGVQLDRLLKAGHIRLAVAHPTSAPSTSTGTNTSNLSNDAASTDGTTNETATTGSPPNTT